MTSSTDAEANQVRRTSELKAAYDVIVCGASASGSVVAWRVAENPEVQLGIPRIR
jgi:choline dehydrogenase